MTRKGDRKRSGKKQNKKQEEVAGCTALALPRGFAQTHTFTRSLEYGFLPSGAADRATSLSVLLTDLPAWSEFSALFQFVRVTELVATFTYRASKAVASGSTVYYPTLYAADNTLGLLGSSSTKNDVLQFKYKRHTFSPQRPTFSVFVRPRVFSLVLGGSSVTIPAPWVPAAGSATSSLAHYGIATFCDDYNTTQGSQDVIDVVLSLKLAMRGQH